MKKTIIDLFENSVKQYPDNPFLWEKTRDAFEPTTYKEVQQQVYAAGAGLIALGVKKGDNMALLSEGRNAWIIGELAMFYAGAINVPLSIKLEEANDLLHVAQYREDKDRFLAQLPQPILQVSYVLGPDAARHAQAEADQGRRELCDQLLTAVSRRRRLAQMAVETARRAGRVGDFIRNFG